jgi:hypothetical protein
MEIKVKEVDGVESKSRQEVEEALLSQQEEQDVEEVVAEDTVEETTEEVSADDAQTTEAPELKEEDVLSFIKNRYDKEISSVEDLFAQKESNDDIPEDVSAYLEYRKKTGRGFDDYLKLNRDFESMDGDQLLREYLTSTEDGLDDEDIDILMQDYSYDEELDDESDIKKVKLAKKKAIVKAKKFFNEQKSMYKEPLESSTASISESDAEELKAYKQYIEQSKSQEEELRRKREWFLNKTDDLFNDDFKGFDFKIDEKNLTYSPTSSPEELKKTQSDSSNFLKRFMNKDGLIEDVAGYHKAMAVAMNPERFAKFFYEQGKAEATDDVTRKIKNVNMSDRRAPEVTKREWFQVRSVNPDSGRGLKVKSRNKN